ncbi:hypothetical protein OC834_000968 [Tilletia horrida]|uniref:Uncharacterized protein n=1 Tax=Tilletia horrida TaxID=155126 RepID=A0AAN6GEA1_9BASI|nr:hypothetical protein OC842_001833 [Tilletia horrida]KAK0537054.1 hypothetical protein OC834_000968 [Tilletia horrida]KAK0541392.1 hypothetical protein OC835_000183 [Tilletia horrida]KAK0566818.1 hypothetical protein OC844_000567 [Tilletia horrida]
MKLTIASVLSLIGVAAAATNGPFSIGPATSGFEKGVLNTTLSCNVSSTGLNLKNQQILFGVAAILPNRVNASQPFNVVAGTRLIVPASINNLAYGFGARTYAGNATKVIVNAKGATPSFKDAAALGPIPIPSAPVVSGGPTVLEVPGNGGTITVGTFKGATSNSNIIFSFGDITATIKTYNSTGGATFLVANVTCPAQARPASLAYVAVGGVGKTTTVTPTGGGAISTIPINTTAGVSSYTYNCSFSNFGAGPVRISVGGFRTGNQAIPSGSKFAISGGQGNIYLTKQLTDQITTRFSNAAKFSLDVTSLTFLATNAQPSTLNGIPAGGISSPIQALTSTAVVTLPNGAPTTTLPDIAFTASGASGSTALLSLGDSTGVVHVYDSSNNEIFNVEFQCPALSPATPIFPFDIL